MARRNQVSEGGSIIAVQVENEVRLDRSRFDNVWSVMG